MWKVFIEIICLEEVVIVKLSHFTCLTQKGLNKQLNAVLAINEMHLSGTTHIIIGQTVIVLHHLMLHGMLDNLLLKSNAIMLKCIQGLIQRVGRKGHGRPICTKVGQESRFVRQDLTCMCPCGGQISHTSAPMEGKFCLQVPQWRLAQYLPSAISLRLGTKMTRVLGSVLVWHCSHAMVWYGTAWGCTVPHLMAAAGILALRVHVCHYMISNWSRAWRRLL